MKERQPYFRESKQRWYILWNGRQQWLKSVAPLLYGRSEAVEAPPVEPVRGR
jgi:hypothetical protein